MSQQLEKFRGIRVIPVEPPIPTPRPSDTDDSDDDHTLTVIWAIGAALLAAVVFCKGFETAAENAPSLVGILIGLSVIYPFFKDKS